jgi:hypothetical protein
MIREPSLPKTQVVPPAEIREEGELSSLAG